MCEALSGHLLTWAAFHASACSQVSQNNGLWEQLFSDATFVCTSHAKTGQRTWS